MLLIWIIVFIYFGNLEVLMWFEWYFFSGLDGWGVLKRGFVSCILFLSYEININKIKWFLVERKKDSFNL